MIIDLLGVLITNTFHPEEKRVLINNEFSINIRDLNLDDIHAYISLTTKID